MQVKRGRTFDLQANVHAVRLQAPDPHNGEVGAAAIWQAVKNLEANPQLAASIAASSLQFVEHILTTDNVQRCVATCSPGFIFRFKARAYLRGLSLNFQSHSWEEFCERCCRQHRTESHGLAAHSRSHIENALTLFAEPALPVSHSRAGILLSCYELIPGSKLSSPESTKMRFTSVSVQWVQTPLTISIRVTAHTAPN